MPATSSPSPERRKVLIHNRDDSPFLTIGAGIPPSGLDFVVTSVDNNGKAGPLTEYVQQALGLDRPIEPNNYEFLASAGWCPTESEGSTPVVLVVTFDGEEKSDALLDRNLRQVIISDYIGIAWIPLLGTGSGGLSFAGSASIIVDVLKDALNATEPLKFDQIIISGPADMSDTDLAVVEEIFGAAGLEPPKPAAKGKDSQASEPNTNQSASNTRDTKPDNRPPLLDVPREGGSDDLKYIKGVGPSLEKALNDIGLFHFDQIAQLTPAQELWVDEHVGRSKGRISRDRWVEQAKLLVGGPATDTEPEPATEVPAEITDATRFQDDLPAIDDELGRTHIARSIFDHVEAVWPTQVAAERPFIVHLSGRWGSGKSSILNFLKDEMKSDPAQPDDWVIVDYNAWKHHGETEVWWSLLNAVVRGEPRQVGGQHGFWIWAEEKIWRFLTGSWTYVFGGLMIIGLLWAITLSDAETVDAPQSGTTTTTTTVEATPTATMLEHNGTDIVATETLKQETKSVSTPPKLKTFSERLKDFGGQVTLIIGLIGLLGQIYSRRTKTAEAIKALDTDPTAPLHDRYQKVIHQIGRPVAVFIDDLDRCEAPFVVKLLQALQNVYSDVPVLYVVAADREWIVSSYGQVYRGFRTDMSEPGRPLGHLFVEKIFQLSVNVPDLGALEQKTYLDKRLDSEEPLEEPDAATLSDLQEAVSEVGDDLAGLTALIERQNNPVLRQRAAEFGFSAVTSKRAEKALQHRLSEYSHLMDPNPRAIKRLVNAYAFRYGFALLSGETEALELLPRWSILDLRFPYAARKLAERPELIDSGAWRDDEKTFPDPQLIGEILGDLTSENIVSLRGFG